MDSTPFRIRLGATVVALAAVSLGAARPLAAAPASCRPAADVWFLASPRDASAGAPARIVAVAAAPRDATLTLEDGSGRALATSGERHGVTPSWWVLDGAPGETDLRVRLRATAGATDDGACEPIGARRERTRRAGTAGAWPVERGWDRGAELLYSAWVERLFDDPLDAEPSWRGLDAVLADPARNFLHDHLGLGEDDRPLGLEPDCADLPYFLRAYFAWKLGLPFGYSACSRGGAGNAPRCTAWRSNADALVDAPPDAVARVGRFLRRELAWTVQSGSARTGGDDDRTDLYPTRLAPASIRPGTVYADPYGHTLVVVQRVPQTPEHGGILLAVDAQPDGTIARKRYWRGTFLFAVDPTLGGAGFKHFRPIVRDGARQRPLGNREIAADHDYGDYSLEQYAGGAEDFYDRMDDMLSPTPMEPARVLRETIDALEEQVRTRVTSVATGETYVAAHPETIAMPSGPAIFETTGAWEDYATPSRDLRLLIAIDVVRGFPARVARRPNRYAMPAGTQGSTVRDQLAAIVRDETAARRFTYTRSDGSQWTASLADLMDRAAALEMAYNPNDCVEIRWGAAAGGDEASTCRRHAPREQLERMDDYRVWFHERRRPARE